MAWWRGWEIRLGVDEKGTKIFEKFWLRNVKNSQRNNLYEWTTNKVLCDCVSVMTSFAPNVIIQTKTSTHGWLFYSVLHFVRDYFNAWRLFLNKIDCALEDNYFGRQFSFFLLIIERINYYIKIQENELTGMTISPTKLVVYYITRKSPLSNSY